MIRKNFIRKSWSRSIFHTLIIAIFLFSLSGCGYKASPFYTKSTTISDDYIDFKLRQDKK